ncbi:hypothetical protein M0813_02395 [Anaeramoeba flamelloides]|uniref:Uncharacterized protein n=1 Tax=Anaeramoeba flamelloides TaxID=1746091 RepID=A0ABQ8YIJ8_9EUKA|nr:hypothetical protein M0813_02395 [Anaeramoeba flamelloides]
MNKNIFPPRRRTINQVRLETLLTQYSNSVQGMTLPMLFVPNSPKDVTINNQIFQLSTRLSKENVFAYMISKYNLFPKINQNNNECVEFKFTPTNGLNSLISYADSEEFEKQKEIVGVELKKAFQKHQNYFKGFEIYHFSEQFQLPKTVVINKGSLKQLFKDKNEYDVESRVKKVYRGFAFFFGARYNLINATRKNRKTMKFTRDYAYENGDQNLNLFGLFFSNTITQLHSINNEDRKRLPIKIQKQKQKSKKRTQIVFRNPTTTNRKCNSGCNSNNNQKQQIHKKTKLKRTFSEILREEQAKTELGLQTPSTVEKLKDYTEDERELVKILTQLKYYRQPTDQQFFN